MSPTLDAFLCSWPFDAWLLVALILPAAVYGRGWLPFTTATRVAGPPDDSSPFSGNQ